MAQYALYAQYAQYAQCAQYAQYVLAKQPPAFGGLCSLHSRRAK